MSLVPQRATPRWKEWIPLVSQQQRLRNLIQVLAYNVPWHSGSSMYFTLHLTTMSPPFYTSEKLQHQNPKWDEMDLGILSSTVNTSATGVVIRLWLHEEGRTNDQVVLVWGLHFSGLVYLGPRLNVNATNLNENTVILHLQGGYFTDLSCVKEPPSSAMVRYVSVTISASDVRPSYTVSLLLRLRTVQQAIKVQTAQSCSLRDKILAGGLSGEGSSVRESVTLRKLLSRGKPKPQQRRETLAAKCQVELLRFRVALLQREKQRKLTQVNMLQKQRDIAAIEIADRSCELTENYQNLHKEIEQLKESRQQYVNMRETVFLKTGRLNYRRRQLMSQLNLIYPVSQQSGDKYTICGIHLPNSEELTSSDDITVSVALGFVAHLIQMISIFLQVPLRYPIVHFGSRSRIIDHITDKIPEKEREFPLFSRGKDKLQFHYGVYLLNKDIAQLRWLVGYTTQDLRTTLKNVYDLLHLNHFAPLDNHHRSMSGSSLDVLGSSANVSPVGSLISNTGVGHPMLTSPGQSRARHRSSKSMGSEELLFPGSRGSSHALGLSLSRVSVSDGMANGANLSYSLDKGLDEYEEIKNNGSNSTGAWPTASTALTTGTSGLSHVGSEPNLNTHSIPSSRPVSQNLPEFESDAQNQFLKGWEAGGGSVPVCSDDDVETLNIVSKYDEANPQIDRSEFSIVTERIVELIDSNKRLDSDEVKDLLTATQLKPDNNGKVDSEMVSQGCNLESTANDDSVTSNDVSYSEEAVEDQTGEHLKHRKSNNSMTSTDGDIESVDVATDALADIPCSKSEVRGEIKSCDSEAHIPFENERWQVSEENGIECVGVEESVLVDNLFANVTSRTEALASRSTSFNLMSSRHGSTS